MAHPGTHLDLKKGWNVQMFLFGGGEGLRKICFPNWWSISSSHHHKNKTINQIMLFSFFPVHASMILLMVCSLLGISFPENFHLINS